MMADTNEVEAGPEAAVADEATGPPVEPEVVASASAVSELEARISSLEAALEDLRAESHKDRIISQNAEKIGALEKRVSATRDARATAMLHHDLVADLVQEYAAAAAQDGASARSAVLPDMQAVMSDLESHLLSLGIQPFGMDVAEAAPGSRLALASQRAVAVEATIDPAQDYVVVRSVRAGFRELEGGIVRKQDVVIRRCRETAIA